MCNFFNDEFILGISITFTLGYICNHICHQIYNFINETSKSICCLPSVEEVVIYSKTSICTFKTMEELRQSNYLDDPSLYYDYEDLDLDVEVIDENNENDNENDNNELYIALDATYEVDYDSDDDDSDDEESESGIQQFQPISLMIHINPKTKLSRLYEKITIKDYDSNSEEYVMSNIIPKCVTLTLYNNDIDVYKIDILNPLNVNVVGNNILTYTFLCIYMKEVHNVEINKNYKVELETIHDVNFTLTHGSYITVHADRYELFPSLEAN